MIDDPYEEIKKHFADIPDVTVNAGKGSQGLILGKKMFVMFYKGQLLVQLPPERVLQLTTAKEGMLFDPGTGKPLKDRLTIPDSKRKNWIALCEESLRYMKAIQ